jgi:hypothetical protein
METKGTELIINGTSGQASSLIGLLQKAPGFDDPHFLSPVTQQRGKELFNLSATINMPFPREPGMERPVANPEDRPPSRTNKASQPPADSGHAKPMAKPEAPAVVAPKASGARLSPTAPQAGVAASSAPPGEQAVIDFPRETPVQPVTNIRGSRNSAPVPDRIISGSGS